LAIYMFFLCQAGGALESVIHASVRCGRLESRCGGHGDPREIALRDAGAEGLRCFPGYRLAIRLHLQGQEFLSRNGTFRVALFFRFLPLHLDGLLAPLQLPHERPLAAHLHPSTRNIGLGLVRLGEGGTKDGVVDDAAPRAL